MSPLWKIWWNSKGKSTQQVNKTHSSVLKSSYSTLLITLVTMLKTFWSVPHQFSGVLCINCMYINVRPSSYGKYSHTEWTLKTRSWKQIKAYIYNNLSVVRYHTSQCHFIWELQVSLVVFNNKRDFKILQDCFVIILLLPCNLKHPCVVFVLCCSHV